MKEITIKPTTILAGIFTVLKLTKVIDWSWLWVLSPIWIMFAIYSIIAFAIIIKKGVKGIQDTKDTEEVEGWQNKLKEKFEK
jgi:hypothetical protein